MSISSIGSAASVPLTAASAVASKTGQLQTQIDQYGIKDEIKLSKEAVSLLLGGGSGQTQKS